MQSDARRRKAEVLEGEGCLMKPILSVFFAKARAVPEGAAYARTTQPT